MTRSMRGAAERSVAVARREPWRTPRSRAHRQHRPAGRSRRLALLGPAVPSGSVHPCRTMARSRPGNPCLRTTPVVKPRVETRGPPRAPHTTSGRTIRVCVAAKGEQVLCGDPSLRPPACVGGNAWIPCVRPRTVGFGCGFAGKEQPDARGAVPGRRLCRQHSTCARPPRPMRLSGPSSPSDRSQGPRVSNTVLLRTRTCIASHDGCSGRVGRNGREDRAASAVRCSQSQHDVGNTRRRRSRCATAADSL